MRKQAWMLRENHGDATGPGQGEDRGQEEPSVDTGLPKKGFWERF